MVTKFRAGDSVRSSEGGPLMTVKEHDHKGRAVCSWSENHVGWRRQAFDEAVLSRSYQKRPAAKKRKARKA